MSMNTDAHNDVIVDIENPLAGPSTNGSLFDELPDVPVEELEKELPVVYDGQIPLGELLSRVVQTIYAELSELAETMPNMSDTARKRTMADWVVKTKKQVVKLYAVAKWSRDADTIQKCMNITAFLMTQNQQFEGAIKGLTYGKESLDPARLRNHDILTSLDVLTTGSYLRLPTIIKKMAIPVTPLTDEQVQKTLSDMEDVMRYRLRMSEVIPVEMSRYQIADGRVHFSVPGLFNASVCLGGATKDDGWFFVDVEFLINVRGDLTGLQEFPRIPSGIIKRHITDEADARLTFYLTFPEQPVIPGAPPAPPRPKLREGIVDAPLVRLYNFLQMMSLSYQLEILWYQAERMRSLGWADYLSVMMSPDRKTLKVTYWLRRPPAQVPGRPRMPQIPLMGGTLTIAIVQTKAPKRTGSGPARTPQLRAVARIQQKAKLGALRPSDEVEGLTFSVKWEPAAGALGIPLTPAEIQQPVDILQVDPENLDFEKMLRTIIHTHVEAILTRFQLQLRHTSKVFSPPGMVTLVEDGPTHALRVYLCGDEVVMITVDTRTGRVNLRDIGGLAAAGQGFRHANLNEKLNENPLRLSHTLHILRITTILDLTESKANYLGLQNFRRRNIVQEELAKLGADAAGLLFIRLANFKDHYLVLVITDERFKFALITTQPIEGHMYSSMAVKDIAWLDYDRIHEDVVVRNLDEDRQNLDPTPKMSALRGVEVNVRPSSGFNLDTQGLRLLYNYCSARVAFMNVEQQFKLRGIPFTHVNPTVNIPHTFELSQIQSPLARSVPALCVQSKDILSGAPAAEAAMPNIRVIPLNWWSREKAQVITCVKLKYVQQPVGKTASGGNNIIRPSKRIIYDSREAIVYFLSEDVNTCVNEFLEEWARVSKMVVIAREVAQMSKKKQWRDVRLLSFDLQTVEFVYSQDYTVSISCQDQLSLTGGNFDLEFGRKLPEDIMDTDDSVDAFNPHEDAEPFLRDILRHAHGGLAPSLHELVTALRNTLPIVVGLEAIRKEGALNRRKLQIFVKDANWYRLLYGDLKHALDFRLMSEQRVVILDASHSLFHLQTPNNAAAPDPALDDVILQPITGMREIVKTAVKDEQVVTYTKSGKVTGIDVGVICNAAAVGPLTKIIHAQVLERLKS